MSYPEPADGARLPRMRLQPMVWVAAGMIIAKLDVTLPEAMTFLVDSAHRDHISVETLASGVINEEIELHKLM